MNENLEVLITSSSRPQLFPFCWESFKKMCIIRDKPKVTVHEDFVYPAESEKVMTYLKGLKKNGEIDVIDTDQPAIGLGRTLNNYSCRRFEKKYIFYLQEDWEFERPIDIDQITYVMDQNPKINLIFFNKIRNNGVINKQRQTEYTYSDMTMCLYHAWTMLPGIWRASFVEKHFPGPSDRPEGAFTNQFGSHAQRSADQYCVDAIGAYIYGRQGEHRYVRHLGNDWRMAKWRLERHGDKVVPGGNHNSDTMDKNYMAPWIPYPERPTQRGDLANA